MERRCRWNWQGQTYGFDITKSEHMGRLIIGLTVLKAELERLPKKGDADREMTIHNELLRNFFDIVLGEGKGQSLCGRCTSAYALAYLDFMEFVFAQLQWLEEQLDVAEERYRLIGVALGWIRAQDSLRQKPMGETVR